MQIAIRPSILQVHQVDKQHLPAVMANFLTTSAHSSTSQFMGCLSHQRHSNWHSQARVQLGAYFHKLLQSAS
jgi:hypothetical protein